MTSRLALLPTWLYRCIILRLTCPAKAMIVESLASPSARVETNECRASCHLQLTPAAFRASDHDTLNEPMGLVGSIA